MVPAVLNEWKMGPRAERWSRASSCSQKRLQLTPLAKEKSALQWSLTACSNLSLGRAGRSPAPQQTTAVKGFRFSVSECCFVAAFYLNHTVLCVDAVASSLWFYGISVCERLCFLCFSFGSFSSLFISILFFICCLFSTEKEEDGVGLGRRRGRDNLGGTRGGETLIRMYYMKKVLY